ncbi:ATP-binding protein [Kineococcus sp. LSe6-4]|uniref:ATP-binding protein n=1 Tax=Kineococcus halophytocola TaxID=3234027 RepID=A0ABV4H2L7_9ACTN
MSLPRPDDLFDRVPQWEALSTLVGPPRHRTGLRLGIVSGRRRHGKSYLLRRLVAATDGLYHQARELDKAPALDVFARDVADHLGYDPAAVRFDSWETALRVALGLSRPDARRRRRPGADVLVIDELPYLLAHSPEIPSVLQLLHDEVADDPQAPTPTVIVCGSALSVMNTLLTGSQPLRGRAQLELTTPPFDFRDSRAYWGIEDPQVAFELDAVLGGTPGYRALVTEPPPPHLDDWVAWLGRTVLNPASALFNEKSFLLREDPRNLDRNPYTSIVQAVADGRRSPTAIGAAVSRDLNTLRHPLTVLENAGFLVRTDDVLTARRPSFFLADPIVRFTQVVVEPHRALLEEGDTTTAWAAAAPGYSAQVLGPHFEHLARTWTARYSADRWGTPVGEVGPAVLNDPAGRTRHEIDVLALARGHRRHDPNAPVIVLGEATSTRRPRTSADLDRLDALRGLLARSGRNVERTQLALFSRAGFEVNLVQASAHRADVHLIDLTELYDGRS